MTLDFTLATLRGGSTDGTNLLARIASLSEPPFASQVVQSPWNAVIDSPSLHQQVKARIRSLLDGCCNAEVPRCLTIVAPTGYGKTHLLAWTRQLLDQRGNAVFIYVCPYLPSSSSGISLEQHVMRATIDALGTRSIRQREAFGKVVRAHLVYCYDRIIETASNREIKSCLGAGTFWTRLFCRWRLKIGRLGVQDQLAALQRALRKRYFLERAFEELCRQHLQQADGAHLDWETFVAACLLTCGDTEQRWHAGRWFHADPIPPDVRTPFFLDHPCQGTEKIRNGLYTLQGMVGQSFCLAFDQLEDTYQGFLQPRDVEATRFAQQLSLLIGMLSRIPNFCLLFSCQLSVWQDFALQIQPMLRDRMVEGFGVQSLLPLDDSTAQELIQERMRAKVWNRLAEEPPADQPYFPFSADEIREMRIRSGGELRGFLQQTQERFHKRICLDHETRCPLTLRGVTPREVISHEPTPVLIYGENFPEEVRVLFADLSPPTPPICRASAGEIDVTTPVGLLGDVSVRVEAADDPNRAACIILRFMERQIPRPYYQHIDREKLRARRRQLGLTQKQVEERVGLRQGDISRLETSRWRAPSDDLFDQLAKVYEVPLSAFLREPA